MEQVPICDVRVHLSELIDRVRRGEEFTITRRGIPVARLVPSAERVADVSLKQAYDKATELRQNFDLKGLEVRDLIEEGRR